MSKSLPTLKMITGFGKVENLMKLIKFNGGFINSVKTLYLTDDLKIGTLIGEDDFGNKYFENPYYFVPRNRWVIFNPKIGLKYNASQIPPEWHRWMTHMTEYPPTVEESVKITETRDASMPHNTVRPKEQALSPSSNDNPRISIKETCFIAIHPDGSYLFEHTRPVPKQAILSKSILKVDSKNMITQSPNFQQLQALTYTPSRYWLQFPGRVKRNKLKECYNDNVDRPGLTS